MMIPYIVDAVRSPIGAISGCLSAVRADDLAAHVIRALVARHTTIDPTDIADVVVGCANQAGEDNRNIARMSLLLAGLPYTVPGETVNRLCASGMAAAVAAARAIVCGDGDLFVAGGVEQMTRAPWVMSKSAQAFGRDAQLYDSTFGWRFINQQMQQLYGTDSMGMTAENVAEKYQIGRDDQDLFAYRSQQKAAAAQQTGRFDIEIAPIAIPQRKGDALLVGRDEFLKPTTTPEGLAALRPAFKTNGTVTAGNASGLNDGAAAILLASEQALTRYALRPLARMVSWAVSGVEPRIMGIGPVVAANHALKKAGLRFGDLSIIELNEAFAAQVLACTRLWGLDDDDPRTNPNGGAIALGHPLGMSGARLLQTAAIELNRQPQARYALCTMCIGVGQGYAVVLERC
ncbi:MAG: acetyl-CoA C-acyltransferase [Sphingobacteriales bacterium]|nr:acetyl-CoA C-acyltransferase [Sphingobacteriales bacterium]MCC7222463.1 acetyl-CoA C-acyltransferase [Chitinophagales bacterium]